MQENDDIQRPPAVAAGDALVLRRIVDATDQRVRHEATVEAIKRGASGLAFSLLMWVIVASRFSLRWASFADYSAFWAIIGTWMLGLLAHPTWAILRPGRNRDRLNLLGGARRSRRRGDDEEPLSIDPAVFERALVDAGLGPSAREALVCLDVSARGSHQRVVSALLDSANPRVRRIAAQAVVSAASRARAARDEGALALRLHALAGDWERVFRGLDGDPAALPVILRDALAVLPDLDADAALTAHADAIRRLAGHATVDDLRRGLDDVRARLGAAQAPPPDDRIPALLRDLSALASVRT